MAAKSATKVDWEKKLGPVFVRLRPNLHFTRQAIRGDPTYVVHDPLTFKNHVFRLKEYRVMTALIHGRTLKDTFAHLVASSVLSETDKEEYYEFIMVLHRMHLLKLPISDPEILFERYLWRIKQNRRKLLTMLISYKVPLCDPDRFLDRTVRYVSFLFSPAGFAGWVCLALFAIWNLWGRFGALFAELEGILEFSNLPLLWLVLVVLKVLHELGHAYACKRLGGEVPEMGAMILLATPCAYVDASASWKFASKWQRIGVALAGMYVESFVAALCAIVWVSTQQGLLHEIARNVMMLASASTVLFNANPLMRYDGYYVLTDLVDLPNLRERAAAYLKNRAKRLFLGIGARSGADELKHRDIYLWFGVGSVIYRLLLTAGIATMVIMQWPVIGLVVALFMVGSTLGGPIAKLFGYLLNDEETAPVRWRARLVVAGLVAAVPAVLFLLPVSFHVVVPGVLEPERSLVVRAPAEGFVTEVLVGHSGGVDAGDLLLRMDNPDLRLQHDYAVLQRTAEAVLLSTVEVTDLTKAAQHRAQLESIDSRVSSFGRKLAAMQLLAAAGGVIGTWHPESLRGRYFREGEPLLEIQSPRYLVHVILSEEQMQLAGLKVGDLTDLRWSSDPSVKTRAVVEEIRGMVSREEVPPALTMQAGGEIPIRQDSAGRTQAERPYLHVLLEPQEPLPLGLTGMTARVRLGGRIETLGAWLRRKTFTLYQAWQIAG